MKNLYNQKRAEGFTIIEVMIVLAIAAVILLIVLLAVPALQRSNRNTQRDNDAASIAAAINACLANQNGNPANCHAVSTTSVDIDNTKLGQLNNPAPSWVNGVPAGTVNSAQWNFGYRCNGNAPTTTNASLRSFVVMYAVETTGASSAKCVES
jgi:prepilin-type N-terminal cleavage/methylation domain-containing protein